MWKNGITEFGITSDYYDNECLRVILYRNKKPFKNFYFRKSFSDSKFEEIYQFMRATLSKNDGSAFWRKLEAQPDFRDSLRQGKLIEPVFMTVEYGTSASNNNTERQTQVRPGTADKKTTAKPDKNDEPTLVKFRIKAEKFENTLRVRLFVNGKPYRFYTFIKNMPYDVFNDVYTNKLGKALEGTKFWNTINTRYKDHLRNCESFSLASEEKNTKRTFTLSAKPIKAVKAEYLDYWKDPYSWTENVYRPGSGIISKR